MRAFSKLKNKTTLSPRSNESKRASNAGSIRGGHSKRSSMTQNEQQYTTDELQEMEEFPNFPPLKEARGDDKKIVVINKIRLCATSVTGSKYSDISSSGLRSKGESKRQTLLEIAEAINTPAFSGLLQGDVLLELVTAISANLFRSLPPATDNYEPDEDDPVLDPEWPQLQVVYELLLRLVVNPDVSPKAAKKTGLIDQDFCSRLMQLFNSEDPRERDYLKTILHRVYGKFMSHRSFLRRSIANIFLQYVNDDKQHNGVGELLEILGSIVNGFALPLKKEHIDFLCNALLPLHKPRGIAAFHPQLAYCVVQYSEKDTQCAIAVANYMVSVWPWSSSTKQLLLLNELEEILELVQGDHFLALRDTLFPCLAKCIGSSHFQIVERTLFMWHNEILLKSGCLKDMYADQVLPMLFAPLYDAATKAHWNLTVAGLCQKVLHMYQGMDPYLYDTCLDRYTQAQKNPLEEGKLSQWKQLETDNGVDEKLIGLAPGAHLFKKVVDSDDEGEEEESKHEGSQAGIAA